MGDVIEFPLPRPADPEPLRCEGFISIGEAARRLLEKLDAQRGGNGNGADQDD